MLRGPTSHFPTTSEEVGAGGPRGQPTLPGNPAKRPETGAGLGADLGETSPGQPSHRPRALRLERDARLRMVRRRAGVSRQRQPRRGERPLSGGQVGQPRGCSTCLPPLPVPPVSGPFRGGWTAPHQAVATDGGRREGVPSPGRSGAGAGQDGVVDWGEEKVGSLPSVWAEDVRGCERLGAVS